MNYIYCITNTINNKRYVGKTTLNLEERFKEHYKESFKERCNKRPLYDAMNKYGVENFIIEELELVEDNTKLDEREIYWIRELQTYGSNGYNATKGGDGKVLYDYKDILNLANLGYTASLISKKVGCCKDTVFKVVRSHNAKLRRGSMKLVALYDLAGNYIQVFYGLSEASEWLLENGVTNCKNSAPSIAKCCKGTKHCNTAYGYMWKYLPEPM